MSHSYRLVVCIDVGAQSTLEAYGKVYEAMAKITGAGSDMDWESSDEAYTPNAEPISEDELSKVRMAYLDKRGQGFEDKPTLWDNDLIQFARLLDEIGAALDEGQTKDLIIDLCRSMDLGPEDVNKLFDRAEKVWAKAKEEHA